MLDMNVCELAWTGNLAGSSTRVFHGLSAGKMEQPPMTGEGPAGPPPAPPLPLDVAPLEPPLVLLPPPVLPLLPLALPLAPLLVPGLPLLPPVLPELPPELLDPLAPLSPAPADPPLEPPGVGQGFVVFELAQATEATQVPTQNDTIRQRCISAPPRLGRRSARIASGGPAAR
jgi:hypothetical protein